MQPTSGVMRRFETVVVEANPVGDLARRAALSASRGEQKPVAGAIAVKQQIIATDKAGADVGDALMNGDDATRASLAGRIRNDRLAAKPARHQSQPSDPEGNRDPACQ
jgi:hypothetical protein